MNRRMVAAGALLAPCNVAPMLIRPGCATPQDFVKALADRVTGQAHLKEHLSPRVALRFRLSRQSLASK